MSCTGYLYSAADVNLSKMRLSCMEKKLSSCTDAEWP